MRIAFVLSTFPVVTETFIVNQICSLIDNGHDITILAFNENKQEIVHDVVLKYELLAKTHFFKKAPKNKFTRLAVFVNYLIGNKSNYSFSKILKTLNFFKYGKRAISLHYFFKNQWFLKNNDFDIIHCHFAQLGIFTTQLKKEGFLTKEKIVTTFHGCDIDPHKIDAYKKSYVDLFKYSDLFTYNSEYSLYILKQITKVNIKFKFLPVGLDTQKFNKKRFETFDFKNRIDILFCGRLVPFKAPNLAVEITNILLYKNYKVHLTIIGEGILKQNLIELTNAYEIDNMVTFTGAINQNEIIKIMDTSDIFLLPGIHVKTTGRAENQGLVIQEAQAMQLPVVISNAGGMKYGIIDTITGFIIPESDVDDFVEKLELLINDKQLRRNMGKKGREFVVQNFDSKILCDSLVNYYNQILST